MRLHCTIWFGLILSLMGCTNFSTKQAIKKFSSGVQEQNLEDLREASSSQFEQRALRIEGSPRDLKLLKVPSEKFKVEKVESIDRNHRVATIKVGKKDREQTIEYQLTREPKSSKWVVDDLVIAPSTDGEDPPSIAEQMDLLLTSREFLAAWHTEDRERRLDFCTPELQDALQALPPKWFDRLSLQTVGTGRQRTARPEARINGELAVVVVPHPDGELFLELKKQDHWRVNDAALQTKQDAGKAMPSVKKVANTLTHAAEFLAAYDAADRETLGKVSTNEFYGRCLEAADLSTVPLPVAELLLTDFDFRYYKERRELMFNSHGVTYMLTLKPIDAELAARENRDVDVRVDEVTLFEGQGQEVKRISAMFLSHAVVQVYGESLFERDLGNLRKLSSGDFNDRVWNQETAQLFAAMPLPEVESADTHIISTVFHGDSTEVTATQGSRAVTYVLSLHDGWMVVDDIMFPSTSRPTSLKKNLEVLLPMYAFTSALHRSDLRELLSNSADGLDRIVWRQVDHVPDLNYDLLSAMMLPVRSIEVGEPWSVIKLGNDSYGADVKLVREGQRYVVHDVSSWDGDMSVGQYDLMQSLRQRLASGDIPVKIYAKPNAIVHAGAEIVAPVDQPMRTNREVMPLLYETLQPGE